MKTTIDEIYRILKLNGVLIADILSTEDQSFGVGEQIEKNTFVGGREGEDGIPHHYSNEEELAKLLSRFNGVNISKVEYVLKMNEDKQYFSKAFQIEASR